MPRPSHINSNRDSTIKQGPSLHQTHWFTQIQLAGIVDPDFHSLYIPRDDEHLIAVVELMGEEANNRFSELKIVEIPDDVNWCIEEYDGLEWVAERHRTWE